MRRGCIASAIALIVCSGCVSIVARHSRTATPQARRGSGDVQSCKTTIAKLADGPVGNGTDPILLVRGNTLEPLPLPLRTPSEVAGLSRYDSVGQYLSRTSVPDVSAWRNAMTADGFVVAEAIGYQAGPDFYGAEALKFGSSHQAADFQRRTLLATCELGLIKGMESIRGLPGSVSFTLLNTRRPPYRASIVIGANVVHLNLCECVETRDPINVVRRWAVDVGTQLGVRG